MSDSSHPDAAALLRHAAWTHRLARSLVADAASADDLAQETLTRAWQRRDARTGDARSWLASILRSLIRQDARGRARRAFHEESAARPEAQRSTAELVERADTQQRLVAAVVGMDEPYRTTLLLRYFEDLPPRRIAQRTGVPLATVTSRLTRGHERLRQVLERDGRGGSWLAALAPLLLPLPSTRTQVLTGLLLGMKVQVALVVAAVAVVGWLVFRDGSSTAASPEPVEVADAAGGATARPAESVRPAPAEQEAPAVSEGGRAPAEAPRPVQPAEPAPAPPTGLLGVVRHADGAPAAGAFVVLGDLTLVAEVEAGRVEAERGVADGEGRFHHADAAGTVKVTAYGAGAAPSETVEVEIPADGAREVELHLRRGGRIVGEVFRPDGAPAAGRSVRVMQAESRLVQHVTADVDGRFESDPLAPGRWGLATYPGPAEMEAVFGEPGPQGAGLTHLAQQHVDVADGEEVFVSLGAPAANPVTVTGLLSHGDRPLVGMVQWLPEGEDPLGGHEMARTDAEGEYTVELDAPGRYFVVARDLAGKTQAVGEFHVDVPAAAEARVDLRLPAGELRGRVTRGDGAPLKGVTIAYSARGRGTRFSPFGTAYQNVVTDADGRYSVPALAPGTYTVTAGSWQAAEETGDSALLAPGAPREVTLADERVVEDVDFVLEPGVRLHGKVLDAQDRPVHRAAVWVFTENGTAVSPGTVLHTEEDGSFRTEPVLPARTYTVLAQLGDTVGLSQPTPADAPFTIHVTPGTTLRVEARGRPLIEVTDTEGREHAALRDERNPVAWLQHGYDSEAPRIGPLPPGTYRVRATWKNGKITEQEVTITGTVSGERTVTLARDQG